MNLNSVKSTAEMKLDGIAIDAEWRDKSLYAVTLTDAKGNILRIAKKDYSEMGAFVPSPPQKKTVHVVTGKVRVIGTDVREEFEQPYEANSRRSELEQADVLNNIAVTVEEVDIPF